MSELDFRDKALVIINEMGDVKTVTAFARVEDYCDYTLFHESLAPEAVESRDQAEFDEHFNSVIKKGKH